MSNNPIVVKFEMPEIVNAMFLPAAQSIGKTISHMWEGFTMSVETWYGKKALESQHNLELYAQNLKDDISKIPEENLQEPKMNILGPALEASKFYFEEPQYREMFSKLIAASCDSRMNNKIHPFFIEAIKQMNPKDAQILLSFKKDNIQPIVNYLLNSNDGSKTIYNHVFFFANDFSTFSTDPSFYGSILINLQRLGFIQIEYDRWLTDESKYQIFEMNPIYQSQKQATQINPNLKPFEIQKGIVSITPLGLDFLNICT